MDGLRQHFLAHPGLTEHQDARTARCDATHQVERAIGGGVLDADQVSGGVRYMMLATSVEHQARESPDVEAVAELDRYRRTTDRVLTRDLRPMGRAEVLHS